MIVTIQDNGIAWEVNKNELLKCQVFEGKNLVLETKIHPIFGPLVPHKITEMILSMNKKKHK